MSEIDLEKEARAIQKALRNAVAKAKAAGIDNPEFYIECEGPTIFLMDGDHPSAQDPARYDAQQAVRGRMHITPSTIGVKTDVGAW